MTASDSVSRLTVGGGEGFEGEVAEAYRLRVNTMGFNIYTEKISLRSTLETSFPFFSFVVLNLVKAIKPLRSSYIAKLEHSSCHRASTSVVRGVDR